MYVCVCQFVSVAISNRDAQEGKEGQWEGEKVYSVAGLTRTSSKVTASVVSLRSASRRQLREPSRAAPSADVKDSLTTNEQLSLLSRAGWGRECVGGGGLRE